MIRLGAVARILLKAGAVGAQDCPAAAVVPPAQAERGELAYKQHCRQCHGSRLSNGQFGPPLRGQQFRNGWAGRPIGELYKSASTTMPPNAPGSLQAADYADIIAFILRENGVTPSDQPLPLGLEGPDCALFSPS